MRMLGSHVVLHFWPCEHKNAIKRNDYKSLPAAHTYDNCHTSNWTETELLGRAQTKHAREFN